MPLERRATVIDSFSNTPEQIRDVINTHWLLLDNIEEQTLDFDEKTGELKEITSQYCSSSTERYIIINRKKQNNEYGNVFRHEYGHYIDDVIGNYSESAEYNQAFKLDKKNFDSTTNKGNANLKEMLNDLSENTAAFKSEYVSDILSALTINNTEVIEFYKENKMIYSYHNWEKYMLPMQEMKSETFADLFAIYTENNSDIISFMEKWFPNLTQEFQTSMDRAVQVDFVEKEVVKV